MNACDDFIHEFAHAAGAGFRMVLFLEELANLHTSPPSVTATHVFVGSENREAVLDAMIEYGAGSRSLSKGRG